MSAPKPAAEGIYRRLSVRMYGDERFMRLSPLAPSGQALWLYLLTGPHTGPIPGVFVVGRAALAETLGWSQDAFNSALGEILSEELVEFDEKSRMWFVPNAIRHNQPPNPNVVKSWRGAWLLLPECPLRERVRERLLTTLAGVSDAFASAFRESIGDSGAKASGKPFTKTSGEPSAKSSGKGLGDGSRKQEQEAGAAIDLPSEDLSASSKPRGRRAPGSPGGGSSDKWRSRVVQLYTERVVNGSEHELAPKGVKVVGPKRQREVDSFLEIARVRAKARLAETLRRALARQAAEPGEANADSVAVAQAAVEAGVTDENLDALLGAYFTKAGRDDHIAGIAKRGPGHEKWRADLSYVVREDVFTRVLES